MPEERYTNQRNYPSFLGQYLETIPQGVYQSYLKRQKQPLQNYFGDMFGDFYSEYQGALAQQAQGGQTPTLDFGSFLNTLDLENRYRGLTSRQKGFWNPAAAPRTRFLSW